MTARIYGICSVCEKEVRTAYVTIVVPRETMDAPAGNIFHATCFKEIDFDAVLARIKDYVGSR